jgi:hypothetical protein
MPKVWLAPNVASRDLLRMFTNPEEWAEARDRINVVSLVQWSITVNPNPQSGPNTADAFLACVPGGAFRWLADHGIELALEASAVKEWSCAEDRHKSVDAVMETLNIIHGSGGSVSHIVMDEPFVRGLLAPPEGCGYTVEQTAHETKLYIDAVHALYPDIQIGLVEAYPAHQDGEITQFVVALQDAGCALPFLHIDVDLYRVKREKRDKEVLSDLRILKAFCAHHGLRFGAVVWGERGSSNADFCADAAALAKVIDEAVGFGSQDDIVFQSWSTEHVNGQGAKVYPDNLPERSRTSHTGFLLGTLRQYGVDKGGEPPKEDH